MYSDCHTNRSRFDSSRRLYYAGFLTVVNTFSCTFSEKYFLSFVIPPFHLGVVIALIVNRLDVVELQVEYGWNYMKFHP